MGFYVYKAVIGRAGGTGSAIQRVKKFVELQQKLGKKMLSVSSSLLREKEVSDRQEASVVFQFHNW